jgi:hypothetical protein
LDDVDASWVPPLLTLVGVIVSAVLLYRSTRLRDKPTTEAKVETARTQGARAVSEAWAEYATRMEDRLERAEQRLDDCEQKERELRRRLNGMAVT